MLDLTTEQIDRLWHRMGSFSPNDHRTFAREVLAEAARQAEQKRLGRESTAFNGMWKPWPTAWATTPRNCARKTKRTSVQRTWIARHRCLRGCC